MKTNRYYLALVALALSSGAALLWVHQDMCESLSQSVESAVETPRASPPAEDGSFTAQSDELAGERAHEAMDHAASERRRESIPAEDSRAELAVLDQLARDIANGRAPGEVFEALSADFSASLRDAAVRIFAGKRTVSSASFDTLPPSFVDVLSAVLRKQADQDGLSRALDTAWRETSDPNARRRLESLEIPGLYAARVAEYAAAGDTSAALIYLARFETCDHSGTPDYLAALAEQPGIDVNELCTAAWNWSATFPMLANSPDLTGRLTDPAFSFEQRIIAASILAAAAPGAETIAALDKATRTQPSAEWRAAFEIVRDLALNAGQASP